MARIFITGSADGLGKMAALLLVKEGHQVVLHARSEARGKEALAGVPGAETVVTGDLSSMKETLRVAQQINDLGAFDAVIHNAGVGYRETFAMLTADGLPFVFAVNSVAPYLLTCTIQKPKRLVYISSGLHQSGDASLQDLAWKKRAWNGFQAYADSKLHDAILALLVARRWQDVRSNAVEPGWVATKMGGAGAPDSLAEGPETQAWLATSQEKEALVTGKYFYHKKLHAINPAAQDEPVQERLLHELERISGVALPA